ncbi:hypothetical protein C8A01DRAFT_36622 [Parachaetomium inaequale]|uniref:Uncharacterized protein n=1 Tax=Parachaetomium inaequale TaxID=2588326 RepID=A0AAN6SR13_9PEZI|nr:hypothetical protein C8A01DRAFT_36622 [Parachaetomium inaequale]
MCGWEEVVYRCDPYHNCRQLRRTPYSCTVHRRHVYGTCRFSERRDRHRVSQVFVNDDCPGTQQMWDEYIVYEA